MEYLACTESLRRAGLSAAAETLVNFWHSGALALTAEHQSAQMPEIKNVG